MLSTMGRRQLPPRIVFPVGVPTPQVAGMHLNYEMPAGATDRDRLYCSHVLSRQSLVVSLLLPSHDRPGSPLWTRKTRPPTTKNFLITSFLLPCRLLSIVQLPFLLPPSLVPSSWPPPSTMIEAKKKKKKSSSSQPGLEACKSGTEQGKEA